MRITTEGALVNKGREILESHFPDIEKTPGYLGWRMQETVDFLPHQTSIFLLVKVEGDTPYKDVAEHIEKIEDMAYAEFADLDIPQELEGKVNIFIFMDFEEET